MVVCCSAGANHFITWASFWISISSKLLAIAGGVRYVSNVSISFLVNDHASNPACAAYGQLRSR